MGRPLGQHFLKHAWAAAKLAHAVPLKQGETFLEIGPGKGVLTRELLKMGPVIAVEKDLVLVELLKQTFPHEISSRTLRVIAGDIRDFDIHSELRTTSYVLAANIPYYITGEIIRTFLETDAQPRAMALLIQKEVARRIVSAKETILSLSVKAYGIPKIVDTVSRAHFSPPPQVDSAILVIDNISKDFFTTLREEQFFAVVRAGFASKRKLLLNNLAARYTKERARAAMAAAGIELTARAEAVSLGKWRELAKQL